jgi:hypothetical protein
MSVPPGLGPTTHAVERWAERIRDYGSHEANRADLLHVLAVAEPIERPEWLVSNADEGEYLAAADVVFVVQGTSVVTVMTRWDHGGFTAAMRFRDRFVRRREQGLRERRHAPHERTYRRPRRGLTLEGDDA